VVVRALVVFEDASLQAFSTLTPLRGVYDLRCGAQTLLERQVAALRPERLVLLGRPELHALIREAHPQAEVGACRDDRAAPEHDVWFVNGRFLALGGDLDRIYQTMAPRQALLQGDSLLLARCAAADAPRIAELLQSSLQTHTSRGLMAAGGLESWLRTEFPDMPIQHLETDNEWLQDGSCLIDHIWELVHHNPAAILDDFARRQSAAEAPSDADYPGVHLLGKDNIRIGANSRIAPSVVLDASEGPIILGDNVTIQPHSYLHGPLYVGSGSLLKAGSKIHEGTTIGPMCKVGGEIEESVIHGFSNKQHEGFLGHAYLGEWVNLGADTNNSDLKNNYSNVRVWEAGQSIDTGMMFVGLIAGDHVKSAINTQFNTGTVVGLSSQVFGAGFPPKYIPPFSWGGAESIEPYAYDRALSTARVVMLRRQQIMTAAYETAFQLAWERSGNGSPSN
jgi:UDP-N-acetylglucosamine diphosphorylase/glucosamine-1-phosphate N-acetyltransferase